MRHVGLGSLLLAALASPWAASAQEAPQRTALRVCQDPNNMPFSNKATEGIENRLAELFGKALGLPVTYFWIPQRMNFVRNSLRYKLPDQDYPCDIMMGVPVGFDQVSVTKPYYRSTYALVFAQGKGMDNVKSTADFLALGPERLQRMRIALFDRGPASEWLAKHNLVDQGVPYKMLDANPDQYPGEILEGELATGKVDAAIVWGPLAGYYAMRVQSPKLTVVPMSSEHGVKFDYEMAMGVRYGEREWKQLIEKLIESHQPEIQAILKDFNVPLLDAVAPAAR